MISYIVFNTLHALGLHKVSKVNWPCAKGRKQICPIPWFHSRKAYSIIEEGKERRKEEWWTGREQAAKYRTSSITLVFMQTILNLSSSRTLLCIWPEQMATLVSWGQMINTASKVETCLLHPSGLVLKTQKEPPNQVTICCLMAFADYSSLMRLFLGDAGVVKQISFIAT